MAEADAAANVTPVAELSFETALAELESVVRRLESGEASLEDSIDLYARGAELRRHCEAKLDAAERRVELIVQGPDGSLGTRPLDPA
jgi:exodeoxyribonuclease VII small subunit